MAVSAESIAEDVAAEADWTDDTLLSLLYQFLDCEAKESALSTGVLARLRDWLRERAKAEYEADLRCIVCDGPAEELNPLESTMCGSIHREGCPVEHAQECEVCRDDFIQRGLCSPQDFEDEDAED